MGILRGQNLRIFIGTKCIAASSSATISINAQLEEVNTKDDAGDWTKQACVGKSWEASVDALVVDADATAETAFSLASAVGTTVTVKFTQTEGDNNRTEVTSFKEFTGSAIIASWSLNAPSKANSTYSVSLTGHGALTQATQ